jgi:hypothetical protein
LQKRRKIEQILIAIVERIGHGVGSEVVERPIESISMQDEVALHDQLVGPIR